MSRSETIVARGSRAAPSDTTNAASYAVLSPAKPLFPQLFAAQALGYEIPGVPMLAVVVRGSVYENHFMLPKVVTK